MKTNLLALFLLACASAAHADSVSFTPASVAIARGGVSQELTLRYHRQFEQPVYVSSFVNIPLAQLDFVEMARANSNSQCVIKNGQLFVDYYLPNYSVFPFGYSAMCKFRLRARFASTIGNHFISSTSTVMTNFFGQEQGIGQQFGATVTITQ